VVGRAPMTYKPRRIRKRAKARAQKDADEIPFAPLAMLVARCEPSPRSRRVARRTVRAVRLAKAARVVLPETFSRPVIKPNSSCGTAYGHWGIKQIAPPTDGPWQGEDEDAPSCASIIPVVADNVRVIFR